MPEEFPKWAAQEISTAKLDYHDTIKLSGYLLDLNEKEKRVDVQFYDTLPDGRYIATMDLPDGFSLSKLRFGEGFSFEVKVFKAALSKKLVDFLKEKYSVKMDDLYRFVLVSAEPMDATEA